LFVSESCNTGSETLTLSGTDILADDQQVLRSVTFSSTGAHPTIYLTSTWFKFNPNRFSRLRTRHLERTVVPYHCATGSRCHRARSPDRSKEKRSEQTKDPGYNERR
jgi:hypothetical protein